MAKVVDIYALPIPEKLLTEYRAMSRAAGRIFRKHGALEYREFTAPQPAMQGLRPFNGGIRLRKGEILVMAIVTYPSVAARKRINAAIEADPKLKGPDPNPFDMSRMAVSSFETIVEV
jgi:alkaline phosphatase